VIYARSGRRYVMKWATTTVAGILKATTSNGENRWKVIWWADGEKRSKTFQGWTEARQFKTKIEREKDTGTYWDPSAGRTTLAEYWPTFLEDSADLRPTTRAQYEGLAKNHILPRLGMRPLGKITRDDIKTMLHELQAGGSRPPTVNKAYQLLRTVLAAAVADGKLQMNPALAAGRRNRGGFGLPKTAKRDPRFLEAADVQRLTAASPDRFRALTLLLGFCGLRVGEALGLRVEDTDMLRRRIRVRHTLTELEGGRLYYGEPKTEKSRRDVVMPAFVAEALAEHLARFQPIDALVFVDGPQGGSQLVSEARRGFVFSTPNGDLIRLRNYRKREWVRACRAAGLSEPEVPRIHDLRHTAASLMAQAGYTMREAGDQLGHSHTTMTDHYTHLFPEDQEQNAAALDALARKAALAATAPPKVVALSQGGSGS
jgi:integrase